MIGKRANGTQFDSSCEMRGWPVDVATRWIAISGRGNMGGDVDYLFGGIEV